MKLEWIKCFCRAIFLTRIKLVDFKRSFCQSIHWAQSKYWEYSFILILCNTQISQKCGELLTADTQMVLFYNSWDYRGHVLAKKTCPNLWLSQKINNNNEKSLPWCSISSLILIYNNSLWMRCAFKVRTSIGPKLFDRSFKLQMLLVTFWCKVCIK